MGATSLTCLLTSIALLPMGIANSLYNVGPIMIYFIEAFHHSVRET